MRAVEIAAAIGIFLYVAGGAIVLFLVATSPASQR